MCDGVPANVGAGAKARLRYCEQKLCSVSIEIEPDGKETLVQTVLRFKSALVEKYGGPTKSESRIPSYCADQLAACIADDRAKIRFEWQWPSRQGIVAWAGTRPDDTKSVKVQIYYSSPAVVQTKAPGL